MTPDRASPGRLRRIIGEIERRPPRPGTRPATNVEPRLPAGWAVRQTQYGECAVRAVPYPLDGSVGREPLASLRDACGAALDVLAPDAGIGEATADELLFLDIETTGLGGAGAIAFLVASGRIEGEVLVIRQYLARTPAEEGALLDALLADTGLGERGGADPVLVTYNGRAFDAPMLDGRATMHRRRAPFDSLRHIDLLVAARKMYRGWLPSCRLAEVEAARRVCAGPTVRWTARTQHRRDISATCAPATRARSSPLPRTTRSMSRRWPR